MKKFGILILVLSLPLLILSSCSDEENPTDSNNAALSLNVSGLEDLGDDYAYEGWIMVDGSPVSAGVFTVDADGKMSKTSFDVNKDDLENATAYILTIEPSPDSDPTPSKVHILAGDFDNGSAALTVNHQAAIGTDFSAANGKYILATPTDGGMDTDENSGVWWLDPAGPTETLQLPLLDEGWKYEGWVVVNGTPVSSGKFTMAAGADESAPYSSTEMAPPFPGEDFLLNAPAGVTFPFNIAGGKVVISVEPVPDNSEAPFLLKPLVADVPAEATDHTLYDMMNNSATNSPTGTATK